MKIAKRQLRRIIREENNKLNEIATKQEMDQMRRTLINAVMDFTDDYMNALQMDPSDPNDQRRVRRQIDDVVGSLLEQRLLWDTLKDLQ